MASNQYDAIVIRVNRTMDRGQRTTPVLASTMVGGPWSIVSRSSSYAKSL